MSLVANAVMAQQAGAGKPRQAFKGPVKGFILAGQSNMQGHAKVTTFIKDKAKKLAKESKLNPADEKAALDKLRLEGLTEHERQIVEKGVSNFEFHYLGSAKILGGIGKGLAEAMVELKQLNRLAPMNYPDVKGSPENNRP